MLALLIVLAPGTSPGAPDCDSLDACLAQLRTVAVRTDAEDARMDPVETRLLERLRTFEGAVPKLVELLADPDVRVASLAAKGLRDATHVDPAFLPKVIAGLDRDLGWLAPVLGRMPSDAAAREAVARFLTSRSAPHNQEAYAVRLSGRRAIPFIVEAARCAQGCSERAHFNLGYVLGEMKEVRALAGPGLMRIAEDEAATDQVARGALYLIAQLQEDGAPLEGELLALRSRRPALAAAVDDALVGIRSPRAGAVLAARLRRKPDLLLLREVITTGRGAHDAGPALVELLQHPDWELRVGAAQALGHVGYAPAVEVLIPLLASEADVRLVWAAAESLGRLRAASAEPALRRARETHWLPAVRASAGRALAALRGDVPNEKPSDGDERRLELFTFPSITDELPVCRTPALHAVKERRQQKLRGEADAARLAKLGYETTIVSYGPDAATLAAAKPGEVIEVTPRNMIEHRNTVTQTPDVALRAQGGWLVGADRGEWSGELVFVGDDGRRQNILDENVENIVRLGSRYVAVTGLAHLSFDHGMLYEVTRDERGTWGARPWRALPSAPQTSWLVKTGELQVLTSDDVAILVGPTGAMQMAPCATSGGERR